MSPYLSHKTLAWKRLFYWAVAVYVLNIGAGMAIRELKLLRANPSAVQIVQEQLADVDRRCFNQVIVNLGSIYYSNYVLTEIVVEPKNNYFNLPKTCQTRVSTILQAHTNPSIRFKTRK